MSQPISVQDIWHFGGVGRVASYQAEAERYPKGIGRKNWKIGKNHQAPHGSIERSEKSRCHKGRFRDPSLRSG